MQLVMLSERLDALTKRCSLVVMKFRLCRRPYTGDKVKFDSFSWSSPTLSKVGDFCRQNVEWLFAFDASVYWPLLSSYKCINQVGSIADLSVNMYQHKSTSTVVQS